jgi:hypothetical protein
MKKIVLLLIIYVGCITIAQAQWDEEDNVGTSIGFKMTNFGISVKDLHGTYGHQGILYLSNIGYRGVYLREWYKYLNFPGMFVFAGAGGHAGVFGKNIKYPAPELQNKFYCGISGVVGLHYNIPTTNFNLDFHWQPSVNLVGNFGSIFNWAGVSVRYRFRR